MDFLDEAKKAASGAVQIATFGNVKDIFGKSPTAFGKDLSQFDPTRVPKASTTGIESGLGAVQSATQAGQQMIADRIAGLKAPTIQQTAAPVAGQIDPSFLAALQARLPSQAQALQGFQAQSGQAAQRANEATEMMRAAAMGQTPSAAQMQQKQAFEQAIAAQMAAQAGRAYDPAAFRQAQVAGQQLMGQQAQQAGILAAQEQEAARKAYAATAQQGAQLGLQQQELQLRAAQGDVQAQMQLAGLQTDIAKAQAGLTTQAGIAGAQIGSAQAISQAELQSQAQQQLNNLTQMYVNMGMTGAEAQLKAQQLLFASEQDRQAAIAAARGKMFGGVTGGLANVAAMMV